MKISQFFSACALGWTVTTALISANAADSGVPPPTTQRRLTEHQQQLTLSSDPASPSPNPTLRPHTTTTTASSPSSTPATIRVLADSTTTTPTPVTRKQKVCRQYLTTQCSDSRSVCIKDCRDRLVQVLALQEAQDAYIAIRGLEGDALGIYVDYREQQDKLTLDSFPQATEWLFLSGIQLNGKLDYDFPEAEAESENEGASQLKSVILAGEKVKSIEKVNFPDQVTTMYTVPSYAFGKLVGTSIENLVDARFPASLEMLDASSNQIDSLSCCGFPDTLKKLYLSYNALDRLEHLVLPPKLETLAFNWNSIAIIRNVTFPRTLSKFYFMENPISLISLSESQWETFLEITDDFVSLDGEPSIETSCVTGYFGPTKKHPFLACLLGEEPAYIENAEAPEGVEALKTGGESAEALKPNSATRA